MSFSESGRHVVGSGFGDGDNFGLTQDDTSTIYVIKSCLDNDVNSGLDPEQEMLVFCRLAEGDVSDDDAADRVFGHVDAEA